MEPTRPVDQDEDVEPTTGVSLPDEVNEDDDDEGDDEEDDDPAPADADRAIADQP